MPMYLRRSLGRWKRQKISLHGSFSRLKPNMEVSMVSVACFMTSTSNIQLIKYGVSFGITNAPANSMCQNIIGIAMTSVIYIEMLSTLWHFQLINFTLRLFIEPQNIPTVWHAKESAAMEIKRIKNRCISSGFPDIGYAMILKTTELKINSGASAKLNAK